MRFGLVFSVIWAAPTLEKVSASTLYPLPHLAPLKPLLAIMLDHSLSIAPAPASRTPVLFANLLFFGVLFLAQHLKPTLRKVSASCALLKRTPQLTSAPTLRRALGGATGRSSRPWACCHSDAPVCAPRRRHSTSLLLLHTCDAGRCRERGGGRAGGQADSKMSLSVYAGSDSSVCFCGRWCRAVDRQS